MLHHRRTSAMSSSSTTYTSDTATAILDSSELPASALRSLESSIERAVTSLYRLQSLNSGVEGSRLFNSVRVSFNDLLKDITSSLSKGYTWMDNPIVLCQLMSSNKYGGDNGQFLSETLAQAIQIRITSTAAAQRCETFILSEFEQLVQCSGLQNLVSNITTSKLSSSSWKSSNMNFDLDAETLRFRPRKPFSVISRRDGSSR
ncbi:hypothetical protein BT96DRAFT_1013438 [Gymnopus androsaceus JB14]|uniref:Uncharacterized protein n=1 Tax=Gymnopus androsaceus JB14 TaxID=1447944 RepID=A0A6A4IIF8_9AGAR|nr:hypothetical protein BT96DRAFT_1013438 [Gymnopus androsaceus JB14]